MTNNKDKLRTNNSEDDLMCQEDIKAVTTHKKPNFCKSIIKLPKRSEVGSKSVFQPTKDEKIPSDDSKKSSLQKFKK